MYLLIFFRIKETWWHSLGFIQGGAMDQKGPQVGLFFILVLFVISVGMLHGRKMVQSVPVSKQANLSVQDTIDLITPLLISKSFDAISQALTQVDQPTIINVLKHIISDEKPNLDQKDQALLLFNIVANVDNPALHKQMYHLLKTYHAGEPVYAYTVLDNTSKGVELIHKIAKRQDPAIADMWSKKSMEFAVEQDNVDLLDQLYALGMRITPEVASKLLHEVVVRGNDVAFVPLLVRTMQADANYSLDGMKTVLIQAVEKKNEPMVRALLEEGADPDKMIDDEIGTAVQNAYERGYVRIEALLKDARKK